MGRRLDRFDDAFAHSLRWLAGATAASIGLIAILIPLNLLLIKTGWGSMWWLYEAVEYALFAGVFACAPWVLRQGAHVRVDVVVSALSGTMARRLERTLDVAGAALCLLLCFYGVRAGMAEYADGTLPDKDLRIENWYMMAIFALSCLLLAIEFGLRLRRAGTAQAAGQAGAGAGF